MSGAGRRVMLVSRGLDPVGTGRQVVLAAEGLVASGWDVQVALVSKDGCLGEKLRDSGIAVHELSRRPSSGTLGVDLAAPFELSRLLRRFDAGMVEAWGWTAAISAAAATSIPRVRGRRMRPRLAIRVATPPGRSWPRHWSLEQSELVLADGEAVAAACRGSLRVAEKVRVLPPGIPTDTASPTDREEVARRHGLAADRPWTLCFAPLEAPSRLERLLWAMDQLDVVHAGIEHVLVGAGSQGTRLARRARVQQVTPRLHLLPCLPRTSPDPLGELLEHAALVWQSGEVALGGAILDAMAAGRPIVAVEGMTSSNLVEDGVSGRIVAADPASELPRHALRILENASLATRYGDAARRSARERFPLESFHRAHAAALEALTSP